MPKDCRTQIISRRRNSIAAAFFIGLFLFLFYTTKNIPLDQIRLTTTGKINANVRCSCVDHETKNVYEFCNTLSLANGTNVTGLKFSCEWLPYLERLNLLNPNYEEKPSITEQVLVTGASSNHFDEAKDNIGSLIEKFRSGNNMRIIFYDFGLSKVQATEARNICHVEYRLFNFSNYPHNVQEITNYRWKFLLAAELMQEFDAFWWADASIRWLKNNLSNIYNAVANQTVSPFLLIHSAGHSILSTTHIGMFKYLPADMEQMYMKEEYGSGLFFVARSQISAHILKWAVLCSLEPTCMEPEGADLFCHWAGGSDRWIKWAGCHRYDQAMINILLNNWWNYSISAFTTNQFPRFSDVMQESRGKYNLKQMCN